MENCGRNVWPFDTYLVFTGDLNLFKVQEEIYVGMLEPRERTIVKVDLRAPLRARAGLYVLRFELRYSFKLHTIGLPISFRVQLDTDRRVGSFSNGSSLKGSASNSINSSSIVMSEIDSRAG